MKLLEKKCLCRISISIFASVFFATGFCIGVKAYEAHNIGYFTGVFDDGGGNVLSSGLYGANSVGTLVGTLKNQYNNGTDQNKTGASFMVNTMMQKFRSKDKTISDTDWALLTSVIQSYQDRGGIDWNAWIDMNVVGCENTYYQGVQGFAGHYEENPDDDAYYTKCNGGPGVVFLGTDGSWDYAFKYHCGNPVGQLGLDAGWTIKPEAEVDKTSAAPGDEVNWTHKITNVGSENTNVIVYYYYHNSSGLGSDYDSDKTRNLPSGSAIGANVSYQSTYTVQPSDLGKTLCRSTFAIPGGKDNSPATVESEPACVTIAAVPTSNSCRPLIVTVRDPYWGSSTDYEGDPVNVRVYVYKETGQNTNVYSSKVYKTYNVTNLDKIDMTKDLTTGDRYKISYKTNEYSYDAEYDGYGNLEYYLTTHNEWTYPSNKYPGSKPVGPCFDYSLTSSVKNLDDYQVEVDSTINITPILASDSWTRINLPIFYNSYLSGGLSTPLHTKTKKTKWQVSQLIVNPGGSPSIPVTTNSSSPCDFYRTQSDIADCYEAKTSSDTVLTGVDAIFNSNASVITAPGINPLVAKTMQIPDLPAGTKICYAFSVHPSMSDAKNNSFDPDNKWIHSAVNSNSYNQCVIVVKKPKVQVKGGDISVGKGGNNSSSVYTTISVKTFGVFGSWGEYGIYAPGTVTGMASGATFANPTLATYPIKVCDFSALTFTNAGTASCSNSTAKGGYVPKTSIPNVKANFVGNGTSMNSVGSVGNLQTFFGSNEGFYIGTKTNGNLTLSGSMIKKGYSIILKVNGKVEITGNLTYENTTYSGISQLPQLVIIADGGIDISNDVTNIDAWLVSSGTINTCSDVSLTDELTTGVCYNQLTVNGPVMANKLYLRRTAGSDPGLDASGEPAEIFNLRADSILWAYSRSTNSGKVQTVYATELPPRF